MFDVAVIGAGPIGSFTAEKLSENGLKVVLLEKDSNPGQSAVCAGGVHKIVADYIGLPDEMIERKVKKIKLIIEGKNYEINSYESHLYLVHRPELNRYLAQRAQEKGVQLITSAYVKNVAPEENYLEYLNLETKKQGLLEAKMFIFADGPKTLAKRIFKSDFLNSPDSYCVGVEYDIQFENHHYDYIEMVVENAKLPEGYYWIFPKRNHLNVGLGMRKSNCKHSMPLWSLLNEFVQSREDLKDRVIIQKMGGIVPLRINRKIQMGNCLVIGDAAGMVNPLSGGGYVLGFYSAKLAINSCLNAFKNGAFNYKVLKSYKINLYLSKNYIILNIVSYACRFIDFMYKKTGISLYRYISKIHLQAVGVAIRFFRVL